MTGGARQRGIERRRGRMPETRGDIAVRPQQIGRAGFGIVARAGQPCGIGKAVIAADADHADAFGHIDRGAIAERQQREPRSRLDESFGQKHRLAVAPAIGASGIEAPGRGPPRHASPSAVDSGES